MLAAIRFAKCCASLFNCDFCTVFKAKSGHFRICLVCFLFNMNGVACICLSLKQDSRCKTICPISCLQCISLFENVSLHLPPYRKLSKLIYLTELYSGKGTVFLVISMTCCKTSVWDSDSALFPHFSYTHTLYTILCLYQELSRCHVI